MKTLHHRGNISFVAAMITTALLSLVTPLHAADSATDSDWQFAGEVYLWGAQMTAKTPGGMESNLPFYKILDNLKMTFMGAFGARKDKWTMTADVIYLDIKKDLSRDSGKFDPPLVNVTGDVELKSWIVSPTVGYAVHDSKKARVEILGGLRYLDMEAGARVFANNQNRFDESVSDSYWDAIVGMRARINLTPQWYIPMYFDIGAGDTDGTWQGLAGIGYRFNNLDINLAYRYMDYNFDDSNKVMADLNVKGIFAGVLFRF